MFWKKRIYADAAAATPLTKRSRRELLRLLELYGNPGALHREGLLAKEELERARELVARSIGAHADEIIFTSGGTEANNLALLGLPEGHAVTLALEHASVLEPLRARALVGGSLTEVEVDEQGLCIPSAITNAVEPDTSVISVQLVNSEVGSVQPVRDIAKEVRYVRQKRAENAGGARAQALYLHTDASQAPLWMELSVEKLGVDLLTLDGQKIGGPKGVGVLYVRRGTPLVPLVRGGGQEKGLRSGTENVALAGAFAVALADAQSGAARQAKKVAAVRDYLWSEVERLVPEAQLNGPELLGARVGNNLNISIPGLDGQMAVIAMDTRGVALSTRSACTSGDDAPSHVLLALGLDSARAKEAVRITLLPGATRGEARRIAVALAAVAERYRLR